MSLNEKRTSYKFNRHHYLQCSLHAEIDVIRKLIFNINKNYKNGKRNRNGKISKYKNRKMGKYKLFVIRKNFSNSMPCKHCTKLIQNSGISKIFYTNGDDDLPLLSKIKAKNMNNDHLSRAVIISRLYIR